MVCIAKAEINDDVSHMLNPNQAKFTISLSFFEVQGVMVRQVGDSHETWKATRAWIDAP